jgi:chaperonin cofactor prefoldin
METKEQLVAQIKGWMANDNELLELQRKVKELKEKRKTYADNLVEIMRKNEIDCFDVNDGKLIYTKTKVKAPLNKTTLVTSLMKYFKDDDEQAKELGQFLLESREEKVKESIRRKIQK